jgi:predicted nucleotidyltransferase
LVKKYQPEKIILFGSSIRGETDKFSDLDFIIIQKTDKPFLQRLLDAPLLPVKADIFVYTPEEFERMQVNENPFILTALENSKVIYSDNGIDLYSCCYCYS